MALIQAWALRKTSSVLLNSSTSCPPFSFPFLENEGSPCLSRGRAPSCICLPSLHFPCRPSLVVLPYFSLLFLPLTLPTLKVLPKWYSLILHLFSFLVSQTGLLRVAYPMSPVTHQLLYFGVCLITQLYPPKVTGASSLIQVGGDHSPLSHWTSLFIWLFVTAASSEFPPPFFLWFCMY